MISRDSLKL